MKCEKCGSSEGDNRIELFWENRTESRKHYVCDECFDEIQYSFKHTQEN